MLTFEYMKKNVLLLGFLLSFQFCIGQTSTEIFNRGLIAIPQDGDIFISWRLFPTDIASGATYNILRNGNVITNPPLTDVTNFVDTEGSPNSEYVLEVNVDGAITETTAAIQPWQERYLEIPTQTPGGYSLNDASVGDLDGDGQFEVVVKLERVTHDNSQSGITDPVFLHAYTLEGELLWSIDLGINIRGGAHYTQFMVYDLDGDGKAEIACKTAPGTKDGLGNYLSEGPASSDNDQANYRNSDGYILSGPEYLTVFEGTTGQELTTVYYNPPRHPTTWSPTSGQLNAIWGDGYGNRVDRFLACVAYFGDSPSLVMCRGYYTRTVLAAWDFSDNTLSQRWVFDTDEGWPEYEGQGAHSLSVGDVDNDGKDEIMYGAMALDDDGTPLYNTNFQHGDATHLSDLIPDIEGLEFYMPHEKAGYTHNGVVNPGISIRSAESGDILWSINASGDIGRGLTADISADHPGNEFWASSGLGVYGSYGQVISNNLPPINFAVWWDGDLLRELLDNITIYKWSPATDTPIFTASGCASNNGTKATPALSGDILGDWREEVIWRASDNQSLRIYSTTIPTTLGLPCLLFNRQYRLALVWQNVGYNQPPHPSFFIGDGMDPIVSTQDLRHSEFKLFPNPAKGRLFFQTGGPEERLQYLDFFQPNGTLVKRIKTSGSTSAAISLDGLSTGLYFVVGKTNRQRIRERVVVIR